jgi:hypothetical protein
MLLKKPPFFVPVALIRFKLQLTEMGDTGFPVKMFNIFPI